tara:strand:+ start:216 stop:494 length:279 start_codon:yes stop_codon:yes gene_type:complete
MMRRIDMKSILLMGAIGLIGLQLWKKRDMLSAETFNVEANTAPIEVRDLYGSVVLVDGEQSSNALAYNQTGGYEMDTIVHSLGQNYSGRIVG